MDLAPGDDPVPLANVDQPGLARVHSWPGHFDDEHVYQRHWNDVFVTLRIPHAAMTRAQADTLAASVP